MRQVTAIAALLLFASSAAAFEGRYEVQGVGPAGSYEGTAVIEGSGGDRWGVTFKTYDDHGAERLGRGPARLAGVNLRFTVRATREGVTERPLRVTLKRIQGEAKSLVATYHDANRRVVRRECWLRTDRVTIPLQVMALTGSKAFPGVSQKQASHAQEWVLAQLNAVFGQLDVSFEPITPSPLPIGGARFDANGDGKLSMVESRRLRDLLESKNVKRRGRVVLVLTRSEFAHGKCRGWTLGDAPASPETLSDLNDNFSLVGLSYLDPNHFHTVAHEVAHQLGLDDLNPTNRRLLESPTRADHLMVSGGNGLHLDRVIASMLERTAQGFPDHGLEGRLKAGYAPAPNGDSARVSTLEDEGLPPTFGRQSLRASSRRR